MNIFNIIILKAFYMSGLWKHPEFDMILFKVYAFESCELGVRNNLKVEEEKPALLWEPSSLQWSHATHCYTIWFTGQRWIMEPLVYHITGWSGCVEAGWVVAQHSWLSSFLGPNGVQQCDRLSFTTTRMFPDPGHTGNGWQTLTHWPMQWQCLASRSGNNMLQHHT